MKLPGHTLVHLTAEQEKSWHDEIAPIADEWANSMPNGDKVMAAYKELSPRSKPGAEPRLLRHRRDEP